MLVNEADFGSPQRARLLGASDIRRLVREVGLRPRRQRGQNFVIDPNTVRRIARTAELAGDDVVLEVGPGLGSLTLALLESGALVTAVEIDPLLAEALPSTVAARFPVAAGRCRVVCADALRLDVVPGPAPTTLVANLPYNVAVPVLLHLLDVVPTVQRGLVLVQKEVADRLSAAPGSRTYGVPSVKAAWYAEVRQAGLVSRSVFWPVPHVDSGLVAIRRREPPTGSVGRDRVFAVVDAAFATRRKTLRGCLATLAGTPERAAAILAAAGVDPSARGETLRIEEFCRIAEELVSRSASKPESTSEP